MCTLPGEYGVTMELMSHLTPKVIPPVEETTVVSDDLGYHGDVEADKTILVN